MPHTFPWALTTWLRRANLHPLCDRLLLSGSTRIATICEHARTPQDLDYMVTGHYSASLMRRAIREIVALPDAGYQLRLERTEEIYDYDERFPGIRASLVGLDTVGSTYRLTIDFAFGDPLTVDPQLVTVPTVGPVLAVATETLFAWKTHALVQYGFWDWRPKDVYDIYILWEEGQLNTRLLPEAIAVAFSSRDSAIDELDDFRFDGDWGGMDYDSDRWDTFARDYDIQLSFAAIRSKIQAILEQVL